MLFSCKIVESLLQAVRLNPKKTVLIHKKKQLSAENLYKRANLLAQYLSMNNLKQGQTCVIAAEPGPHFLEIMYALLMLRTKIAIIDPEMGQENYFSKLRQLNPAWIFADSRLLFLDENPILKKIILKFKKNVPNLPFSITCNFVSVGLKLPLKRDHIKYNKIFKKSLAVKELIPISDNFENIIVYTSGTLEIPKGVVHSDKSLSSTLSLLRDTINAKPGNCVGTYLPHFMLLGIASGITVKTMKKHYTAAEKFKWLEQEKINIFFGPPSELLSLITYCEKNKTKLPLHLQHLMLGSAPVHQGFLQRLIKVLPKETQITCTYGMTEHLLTALADGRIKAEKKADGDYLGKIVEGVKIKITENQEILVRSEQLFERYFHENEGNEWHHTGDLGKLDSNGDLILLGRKKEMIIRRDYNIYPALYENTLKKIPGVNEAALVGVYSENLHDEKVYLAVETQLDDISHLKKLMVESEFRIDKEALPDCIFKMEIPRKGRQNKIDRNAIVEYINKHNL